jgi:hypothetical protein
MVADSVAVALLRSVSPTYFFAAVGTLHGRLAPAHFFHEAGTDDARREGKHADPEDGNQ